MEVSAAVRHIYLSLGFKRLKFQDILRSSFLLIIFQYRPKTQHIYIYIYLQIDNVLEFTYIYVVFLDGIKI